MSSELTIELVLFHLMPGVDEATFVQAAAAITPALAALDGYLGRQLYRGQGGQWIDMVQWHSLEAARAAASLFPALPDAAPFMASIDPASVTVLHGEAMLGPPQRNDRPQP